MGTERDLASRAASRMASVLVNPYQSQARLANDANSAASLAAFRRQLPITVEGYTLSSTYQPSLSAPVRTSLSTHDQPSRSRTATSLSRRTFTPPSSSWLVPGTERCTHQGCNFTASAKSVEIHMMDRHLIFPPGHSNANRSSAWDGDPALKG